LGVYQNWSFDASFSMICLKMLNVICAGFPAYDWNGFERVYAIVGLKYRDYVVIDRFCEIPNSSDTPKDTFTVVVKDLFVIASSLSSPESIVGFAHTHPPSKYLPSDEDIAGIGENLFGIVFCEDKRVWYDKSGEIVVNYLN